MSQLGSTESTISIWNFVSQTITLRSLDYNSPILTHPPWSSGSVLDHRSLPPMFESRHGHIWKLFHLRLRLITVGGRSAHLANNVHKRGRKTSIIIIIIIITHPQCYYWSYQSLYQVISYFSSVDCGWIMLLFGKIELSSCFFYFFLNPVIKIDELKCSDIRRKLL